MAVPDYQSLMLPLLRYASDGEEKNYREAKAALADEFKLTQDDLSSLLPSGTANLWDNRVGWAKTYLVKAGLLESTKRSHFRITSRGRSVLNEPPTRLDARYLRRYPEFLTFLAGGESEGPESVARDAEHEPRGAELTPQELIEQGHRAIRRQLAADLLQKMKEMPPNAFEHLLIDLLLRMGYGGSRADAGRAIGRTNDGGLDGIIEQDRLGLDAVYVQAKRWKTNVGSPEIRDFSGALDEHNATKGLFITTSDFTAEAKASAGRARKRLVLINGQRLAELLIDHGVGVSRVQEYAIHRLDMDYFDVD